MFAYLSWPVVTGVHVGPLMLRPHGALIAVGFFAGAVVMRRSTRRAGIADGRLWDVIGWGLFGGLVGMRIAWDLGHLGEMHSAVELAAVWNGGMCLLGGLIGAVILGGFACRRAGLPIVRMLDMAAPGLALGIAIGRFSDLIIGDHLGKPTSLPWGFRYQGGMHPTDIARFALVLALVAAAWSAIAGFVGARWRSPAATRSAEGGLRAAAFALSVGAPGPVLRARDARLLDRVRRVLHESKPLALLHAWSVLGRSDGLPHVVGVGAGVVRSDRRLAKPRAESRTHGVGRAGPRPDLGDVWIRTVRKWSLWSWLLLTVGIMFGARWAYVELGWGGFWGWDPVENASLLPWLTGTAYLHSVMIQEKRGMLKVWNVFLIGRPR